MLGWRITWHQVILTTAFDFIGPCRIGTMRRLLRLALACVTLLPHGAAAADAPDGISLSALREERGRIAHKQQRIIFNNENRKI